MCIGYNIIIYRHSEGAGFRNGERLSLLTVESVALTKGNSEGIVFFKKRAEMYSTLLYPWAVFCFSTWVVKWIFSIECSVQKLIIKKAWNPLFGRVPSNMQRQHYYSFFLMRDKGEINFLSLLITDSPILCRWWRNLYERLKPNQVDTVRHIWTIHIGMRLHENH